MTSLTRLGSAGTDDLASLHLDLRDPPAHEGRPHVALNFVLTADGRASYRGRAEIGTRTDRELMFHLRSLADAVMIGAGTLRVDPFVIRGERPALAVVVSGSGDLPLGNRFFAVTSPRLVVTTGRMPRAVREAVTRSGAELIVEATDRIPPGTVLAALAERGVRFLLCEGGPRLAAELLHAKAVDELFLTHATLLTSEPDARRLFESDAPLPFEARLERVTLHEGPGGERYERSRIRYS